MSNIVAKIRQRIALKDNNKFNLTCDHITTTDFFKIQPVYFKEMVPNEKIQIRQSTFTRLSPLVNPMYGRCKIVNRAFFVPMRTIWQYWNEFITDTPVYTSDGVKILGHVPTIYSSGIWSIFQDNYFAEDATSDSYDYKFVYKYGTPTQYGTVYRKFTSAGRKLWTILCSLGYRHTLGSNPVTRTTMGAGVYMYDSDDETIEFSLLPLVAYLKIYYDWYRNMGYSTTGLAAFLGKFFADGGDYTFVYGGSDLITALKEVVNAQYDKDYFTSAWDTPVAPNDDVHSSITVTDPTFASDSVSNNGGSATTPGVRNSPLVTSGVNSGSASFSQYAIDALKSLTDYMKRHQLAGSQAMDRMLARFGVKPSDAALKRSVYIGKDDVNVQIADVMANATSTDGAGKTSVLGDYAGKGVGFSGNGFFKYDTNEYGYIIVISVLQPHVGYVQGWNRYNKHLNKLDFFTPEFDSLGVQAIARGELISDYGTADQGKYYWDTGVTGDSYNALYNGIFGYTSRYAEYKIQNDNLTGDFTIPTRNTGLQTWHLFRLIDGTQVNAADTDTFVDVSHNAEFCTGEQAQYDRVFSLTSSGYDHFINVHHFDIVDYAPMAKLFDDYEFDGGNKNVTLEVNGTQLN